MPSKARQALPEEGRVDAADPISLAERRAQIAAAEHDRIRAEIDGLLNQLSQNAEARAGLSGGAQILALADELMEAHCRIARVDELCEHVTLRPGWLPCPHPDCWASTDPSMRRIWYFQRIHAWAPMFWSESPSPAPCDGWACDRVQISVPPDVDKSGRIWAWVRRDR